MIEKDYNLLHSCILTGVKSVLKTEDYSLSFHKLSPSFTEISVNYLLNGKKLENQILCVTENCTDFIEKMIKDIQEKCSAFVVDFDWQNICEKIQTMEVPIIPTFSYVSE